MRDSIFNRDRRSASFERDAIMRGTLDVAVEAVRDNIRRGLNTEAAKHSARVMFRIANCFFPPDPNR